MPAPKKDQIRRHIRVLQDAMGKAGFAMLIQEWWHFDDTTYAGEDVAAPPVMFWDVRTVQPRFTWNSRCAVSR